MSFASTRLSLEFGDPPLAAAVINWEDYSYDSDFLTPCDAFSMKVGDKQITEEMRGFMKGGQSVKLFVQFLDSGGKVLWQNPIFTGFLDAVELSQERGGTFFTLHGRNILGPLCDAGIDPWSNTYKFVEGQTLGDVMGGVFAAFSITDFFLSDKKNRQIVSGIDKRFAQLQRHTHKVERYVDILGKRELKQGEKANEAPGALQLITVDETYYEWIDPTNVYDLADKTIKKLQPLHNETFMQFIERNLQRFHLHCWAMADGSGVVIGEPDYLQEPLFTITNRLDGRNNNVIKGRIEIDYSKQPSAIIAKGFHGGGDFQNTRIRACKVNEFIGYKVINDNGQTIGPILGSGTTGVEDKLADQINKFKGLVPLPPNVDLAQKYSRYFTAPSVPRIVFWEDENSRTQDQLLGAIQRKMSEYQAQALKLHYTVQDHIQNGLVWKHNTIVNVKDETLGIDNPFWVLSVSFKKNRNSGTTTDLVLLPVGTIQFGPK